MPLSHARHIFLPTGKLLIDRLLGA
jgi:hypothetical protein